MSYNNPLHPPVFASTTSSYSAISCALAGGAAAPQFLSPFRTRLPQAPYTPVSKWRVATGRTDQVRCPVSFDYIGYSKQGVPMRELSTRGIAALAQMIGGANDQIFVHAGGSRITFRIIWPGYEHIEWARSIDITVKGVPITRAQLGAIIAQNYSRFVEKVRNESCSSSKYHCGLSPEGGIRFEHLVLVGLHNTFEDVWQADVALDLRG